MIFVLFELDMLRGGGDFDHHVQCSFSLNYYGLNTKQELTVLTYDSPFVLTTTDVV